MKYAVVFFPQEMEQFFYASSDVNRRSYVFYPRKPSENGVNIPLISFASSKENQTALCQYLSKKYPGHMFSPVTLETGIMRPAGDASMYKISEQGAIPA